MDCPAEAREILGPNGCKVMSQYVDILASRGIDWGLIGPREADRLWQRHVFNCLAVAGLVVEGARLVDVGSGAGLPGIPLAVARPDLSVVLLEPLLRRFEFLVGAVEELGLAERVSVVRGRAEDLRDRYDVVTARAVAPLERLLGWTEHLFTPDGELLALKGSSAQAEIEAAEKLLGKRRLRAEVMEVRAADGLEPTNVIRVCRRV